MLHNVSNEHTCRQSNNSQGMFPGLGMIFPQPGILFPQSGKIIPRCEKVHILLIAVAVPTSSIDLHTSHKLLTISIEC